MPKKFNLIYMAKPPYGGWVAFTVHLALKYGFPLYKIGNRTEQKKTGEPTLRDFGYGVKYQNLSIEDAKKLPNILITAIDKKYYKYLDSFKNGTHIVIHDPTEVKGKSTEPVIKNLPRFKVITIRETVKKHLAKGLNTGKGTKTVKIKSKFMPHPFYEYPISNSKKSGSVATSRIDFDKHTDIILKANELVPSNKKVAIYGAKNDLYVYHHLKKKLNLNIDRDYKGTFKKSFKDLNNILGKSKFMVDLSAIKNDGGGSQYTFLEAIHQGTVLVLNSKWVDNVSTPFTNGKNCLVVNDEEDLSDILQACDNCIPTGEIVKEAKKLLKPHIEVDWRKI